MSQQCGCVDSVDCGHQINAIEAADRQRPSKWCGVGGQVNGGSQGKEGQAIESVQGKVV